jgi:hypothetical protein
VFAYTRAHDGHIFAIVLNFGPGKQSVASPLTGTAVLSTTRVARSAVVVGEHLELAPGEGLILRAT